MSDKLQRSFQERNFFVRTLVLTVVALLLAVVFNFAPSASEDFSTPVTPLGYLTMTLYLGVWFYCAAVAGKNGYKSFAVYGGCYWILSLVFILCINLSILTGLNLADLAIIGLFLIYVPLYGLVYQFQNTFQMDYLFAFILLILLLVLVYTTGYRKFARLARDDAILARAAEEDEEPENQV